MDEVEECFPYVQELINSYITSRHQDEHPTAMNSVNSSQGLITESNSPASPESGVSPNTTTLSEEDAKLRNEFMLLLTLHSLPNYNNAITHPASEATTIKTTSSRIV